MKTVVNPDLQFLAATTKQPIGAVIALSEEKRDFDLMIESVAHDRHLRADLLKLNFFTLCKLLIFRYTKDTSFTWEEKLYVARAIYMQLPKVRRRSDVTVIRKPSYNEADAQHIIVLAAFGTNRTVKNRITSKVMHDVEWTLKRAGHRALGNNCRDWVKVLEQIQADKWFVKKRTPKKKKPCGSPTGSQ